MNLPFFSFFKKQGVVMAIKKSAVGLMLALALLSNESYAEGVSGSIRFKTSIPPTLIITRADGVPLDDANPIEIPFDDRAGRLSESEIQILLLGAEGTVSLRLNAAIRMELASGQDAQRFDLKINDSSLGVDESIRLLPSRLGPSNVVRLKLVPAAPYEATWSRLWLPEVFTRLRAGDYFGSIDLTMTPDA